MTLSSSTLLGTLTPAQFIATIWQQQPLLIQAAMLGITNIIDGNDLAGIACEPDGEARVILTDAQQAQWQCEQGPFTAKRFKTLPPSHWTLLVQSVDQWIPEIGALLEQFSFLPRWRLDDIMISYATDGGGVGPHFDYYDVFLLQASGKRRWQVGQRCDETSALREHDTLKLLHDFHTEADYTLETGDMLYLPAGVAHWGTAVGDDCITISIGFRAASHKEIVQAALENIAETLPNNQRYRDTPAAIDADTFCINNSAVDNLMSIWKTLSDDDIRTALVQALGEAATEPRNAEREEPEQTLNTKQLQKQLLAKNGLKVEHSPGSRFAYYLLDAENADLYVDGGMLCTTPALAQAICHGRISSAACKTEYEQELLLALINQGSLITL